MAEVVSNLSSVDAGDVHAIATYMAGVFGTPTPDKLRRGDEALARARSMAGQASAAPGVAAAAPTPETNVTGASIYAAACATCHETVRSLPYGGVNLELSTAISSPDPRNAANIVLSGVRPVAGERSPIMPGFADAMSNEQIVALLLYLRARFGNQAAWSGVEKIVEDARRTQTVFLQTSPGPYNAPADPAQRDKP
jgi:mono/diheme cytochrome c family protein